MKRRDFLKFTSAGVASSVLSGAGLISWSPRAHAETIRKTLYITDGYVQQVDGTSVYFRGYSSSSGSLNVPGEAIVAQEGDTIRITLVNTLNVSTSFVINGLVNSGRIYPGQTRTVEFTAGSYGSYLYYDSRNAPYNRLLGLHGALAVMPSGSSDELYPGSPNFMQQYFWVFNDIDPVWHNRLGNGQTPNTQYTPRYFTINGLYGRPPGAPGAMDPDVDSMADPRTKVDGHLGDRTLIRCINAGKAQHSVHTHGNHMEWLTRNGTILPDIWEKDIVPLDGNGGIVDVIYPYDTPPDAWPPVNNNTLAQAENEGRHFAYPMHLHNEMTQTAAGGRYMFGALTDFYFHSS
ncbi:MAG: multicopper oxidase domain-containing protein [Thiohalophilus sp.]|jgi:FtsP/CotA-like multicopper oxidase with cupredoxin domain